VSASASEVERVVEGRRQSWARSLAQVAGSLALMTVLFHETAWSMVSIWIRSETFAHGFLILPISLWLIWDRRDQLARLAPSHELQALWVLLACGAGWLIAHVAAVLVVEQFMFVAMLLVAVWVLVGTPVARAILFPLAFLFFAVPVGEGLVPPMMEFTATFTVELIRLTGIPVYREGLFFSLPSGNWSVVEACSGVRYLIASVTLGCLYAYLTYRSPWRRVVFVLVSIVVPVFANGVRAYLIVMIAHWSDHKLAVGVDHLIYGWVFFGLVMLILFAIGAIWREDVSQLPERSVKMATGRPPQVSMAAPVSVLLVAGLWFGLAWAVQASAGRQEGAPLEPPTDFGGWSLSSSAYWDWRPRILGADRELYRFYHRGTDQVAVFIYQYDYQRQDAEVVNAQNQMAPPGGERWHRVQGGEYRPGSEPGPTSVCETVIKGPGGPLLVWHWYRVGDRYTDDKYLTKLLQVWDTLTFRRSDAAILGVATRVKEDETEARERLSGLLGSALPELSETMTRAAGLRVSR
jgi:exosortase A